MKDVDRAKEFTEQVMPLMDALHEKCRELGLPMVLGVEFAQIGAANRCLSCVNIEGTAIAPSEVLLAGYVALQQGTKVLMSKPTNEVIAAREVFVKAIEAGEEKPSLILVK